MWSPARLSPISCILLGNYPPYRPHAFPPIFRFLLRTGRIFAPVRTTKTRYGLRIDSDHIQMLSEVIVECLRIVLCGQV